MPIYDQLTDLCSHFHAVLDYPDEDIEDFRMAHYDRCLRLPMRRDARSLNLSNSVAILTYEALRQNGFPGLAGTGEMANI